MENDQVVQGKLEMFSIYSLGVRRRMGIKHRWIT